MIGLRHRYWAILLLTGAFLMGAGNLLISSAQDGVPTPTATAESLIEAVATPAAEGTPVVRTVISEAISGISEMTTRNLIFLVISFLLVVLAGLCFAAPPGQADAHHL